MGTQLMATMAAFSRRFPVARVAAAWFSLSLAGLMAIELSGERTALAFAATATVLGAIACLVALMRRSHDFERELAHRVAAQAEIERLQLHDPLTGLPNRRALLDALDSAMSDPGGDGFSLIALDLKRFKHVNDIHGCDAGDAALRTIADRLRALTAGRGMTARTGGDEFGCLIRHAPGSSAPESFAERVVKTISKPVPVRGMLIEMGASVGVVTCQQSGCAPENIVRAASFAMYRAKGHARSTVCRLDPDMAAEMRALAKLQADLPAGVARGEFLPHFQPIVDLASGAVTGFECLARWQHPTQGMVSPDRFIPLAEEVGAIQDLSFSILRQACIAARDWPEHLTLSVNISPLQLNDRTLPGRLLQLLCATGFAPGRLIVEITENRLVSDMESARAILTSLKEAGVQIALDDFGAGYGGLKHLQELAFNRIKIDRAFVQDMANPGNDQIVRAILSLSGNLHMPVTAEGIETADRASELAALGCGYGQGYWFSRPVDADTARRIAHADRYAIPAARAA